MKTQSLLLPCSFFLLTSFASAVAAPIVEENLCDLQPMKFASWMPKEKVTAPITTQYGFRAETTKDPKRRFANKWLCGYWFPAYTASEKVRVSFKYRGTAKKLTFVLDLRGPNEKPLPGQIKTPWHEKNLKPTAEWQDFSLDIDWPHLDWWGYHVMRATVDGAGEETFCEVKDVDFRELPPERPVGRALTIGGARATEIAILATDDRVRHEEELRAARMFRYTLYSNGGDYLPIRTAKTMDEIGANAVLIGTAAEKAGLFTDADLRLVRKINCGSCAFRVKGTRLGITGEMPVGMTYGVFAAWREMGVEYLGNIKWRAPKAGDFVAEPGFGRAIEPAIAYRGENARNELGLMPELRGRCYTTRTHCTYCEGEARHSVHVDHTMPGFLVSLSEFAKTRPEFFAMDRQGNRCTNEVPWRVQYCMTDPGLMEVTADRILEMMRLHPESRIFPVSPGDGGGNYCKCPRCEKNTMTDNWVWFLNAIAEKTCREFPNNMIDMSIYADDLNPPTKAVPHKNIIGHYCVYCNWPSCQIFDDPVNEEGWSQIHTWRKYFPRLRAVLYPSECGENFNFWPSMDADHMMIRDFALNRAMSCRYFGFAVARAGDMPQTPGFCDLRVFVATRIEENPDYDPVQGAYDFIRDFYGAAAPEMKEFYDIMRAEPKRRHWIQNCEQHLKGAISKELAAKCLPLLDRAEAKLKDDPVNLPAVLHEKQNFLWTYLDGVNRGCGNVSKSEFPEWARRVADFCRICRDTNISYLSYLGFPKWFHDTCFVEFELKHGEKFFETEAVKAIIADPEKGLGGEFPTLQKEIKGGCEIPAKGFVGGQLSVSSWRSPRPMDERCLRRPSSGFGLAMTRLNLKAKPTKDVKMFLYGIDNDHPPIAQMAVVVNEKEIYAGKVPWKKDAWSEAEFVIPASLLQAGDNDIQIRNTTGDGDEKDGACGEMFRAKHNYYWGWLSFEKARFEIE